MLCWTCHFRIPAEGEGSPPYSEAPDVLRDLCRLCRAISYLDRAVRQLVRQSQLARAATRAIEGLSVMLLSALVYADEFTQYRAERAEQYAQDLARGLYDDDDEKDPANTQFGQLASTRLYPFNTQS